MICAQCRNEVGAVVFCPVCRTFQSSTTENTQARISTRIRALLIDGFMLVLFGVAVAAGITLFGGSANNDAPQPIVLGLLIFFGYAALSFTLLTAGQTPGKWFASIRAADKRSGDSPGLGRMLLRELVGKTISGCFFGLGWFWALWDKDGQAWHDKIVDTVVLHHEEQASGKPLVIVLLGAIFAVSCLILTGHFPFSGFPAVSHGRARSAKNDALTSTHGASRHIITPRPVDAPSPSANEGEEGDGTLRRHYVDPVFGYQFDYPASYHIVMRSTSPDSVVIKSPDETISLVAMGSSAADHTVEEAYELERSVITETPTYEAKGKTWVVLSWRDNGTANYLKRFIGTGAQNTFIISFPEEQLSENSFLPTMVERSFRPGNLTTSH